MVLDFDEMREMLDADEERIDDLERQNEAFQERIEELELENHKLGATIDQDNKIILALTRALHKEKGRKGRTYEQRNNND